MSLFRFLCALNYYPSTLKDPKAEKTLQRCATWCYIIASIFSAWYIHNENKTAFHAGGKYENTITHIEPVLAYQSQEQKYMQSQYGPKAIEETHRLATMYTSATTWPTSEKRNSYLEPSLNVGIVTDFQNSPDTDSVKAFAGKMKVEQKFGGFQMCTRSILPEVGKFGYAPCKIESDFSTMTSNITKIYRNVYDGPDRSGEFYVPSGICTNEAPCVDEFNVKMHANVDISGKRASEGVNEHEMTSVQGLTGDYGEFKLCGTSHNDDEFLENDYVKAYIKEDEKTLGKDATFFIKLATNANFNTCPAKGECQISYHEYQGGVYNPKVSKEIFVNLAENTVKVIDLDLLITTEESKKLYSGRSYGENPVYGTGYSIKKVGESTFSADFDAPLLSVFNTRREFQMRAVYLRINSIRYSRTSENTFSYVETLAELGGWMSGVFGVIGLLLSLMERIVRRRSRRIEKKRGREEKIDDVGDVEMREGSEFSHENTMHHSKGNNI
mmetsp:Transcript_18993/g.39573  ORF Transcript_18993/g.39573 Transcript_18993/m.39573 type:complete len:498 (-) Transcript_18993:68-1561(-)